MADKPNILESIAQLASLQRHLTRHLPVVSQKLIADQLEGGADARKLAKAVGRSQGFILQVRNGQKSLTAQQIVDVLAHVTAEARNAAKA